MFLMKESRGDRYYRHCVLSECENFWECEKKVGEKRRTGRSSQA